MKNKKQTAVEWLIEQYKKGIQYNPLEKDGYSNARNNLIEQAKEMEKQQSLELIELSSQLTGVATVDDDISKMTYTDVYNQYYGIKE